MSEHVPYPEENVFLCIGHSPKTSTEFWGIDLEVAVASSKELAMRFTWGHKAAMHRRLDGRDILPAGVVSLAELRAWRKAIDEPAEAPSVGWPIWPRKLYRRGWLIGEAMRWDWVRASTRRQAIWNFHFEGPGGAILVCAGKKWLDEKIELLAAAEAGGPGLFCETDDELSKWYPPGFASREEWDKVRVHRRYF